MAQSRQTKNQNGFLILELMVGIAIAAVLLGAFITLVTHASKVSKANADELEAVLYTREAMEVAKDLEATNWGALSLSCTSGSQCHPVAGSTWSLASGTETLNSRFTRGMYVVDAGGRKLVTVVVSWTLNGAVHTRQEQTYVYN